MKHLLRRGLPLRNTFVVALLLNLVWENAQAPFYQGYVSFWQHFWICLPASLWDAGYITLLSALYFFIFKKHDGGKSCDRTKIRQGVSIIVVLLIGFFTATIIELRALAEGHWAYTAAMPLVPIIHVGLTPFLQLAILSIVTYTVVDREIAKKNCHPEPGEGSLPAGR